MIVITVNRQEFEYDIHSLVKAFYPGQEVKVFTEGSREHISSEGMLRGHVEFLPEEICIRLAAGEESLEEKVSLLPGEDRLLVKNKLKQRLYHQLSKLTGRTLPWGALTGIRPTRLALTLLEEGVSEDEVCRQMQETYLASQKKAELSLRIAKKEQKILSGLHTKEGYSLYLGIPFCPTTCLYCSFTSYPIARWEKQVEDYLCAMEREMRFLGELFGDRPLDTVYVGGGTPTTLTPEQLKRLFAMLYRYFDTGKVQEITVEAGRADSITREKLTALKENGVSRISINPQTMKEETLQRIGRRHTAAQVTEAFHMARAAGFDNINMDMILGLPGETTEDVAATLGKIRELSPENLTVHSLAVKRGSGLYLATEGRGVQTLQDPEEAMAIASEGAACMGMEPYYLYRQKNMTGNLENVGFACEGREGLYNILMMEEKQNILAVGAGAISKRIYPDGRIERSENVKDITAYMERIEEMLDRKKALLQNL
ncbi:MAG: coproporphyrinogen dehydrogenase HemZ [Lachnospiraceae bacterium]|nr:coproporphyrinogen dehydrogenase HemZ [Lachnospiraceae bacterium]